MECLQELGVIAVGLADAKGAGALADEVPAADGDNCPSVHLSAALSPMQMSLPLMMRCAGELHWFTIEPPMSGSELHAMAQAFLFQEHSPPPLLRLVDEDSGVELPNTEDKLESLQDLGVVAVSLLDVTAAGAPAGDLFDEANACHGRSWKACRCAPFQKLS